MFGFCASSAAASREERGPGGGNAGRGGEEEGHHHGQGVLGHLLLPALPRVCELNRSLLRLFLSSRRR